MPKISKYTAVAAPADTDVYVVVQGGVTKKITYAQIKAGVIGDVDALIYKGVIACAGNPNYPAADSGHVYKISTAGRIGGAAGPVVAVGDVAICSVDGTVAGTHAAVGANWNILQTNIDLEPAAAENDFLVGGTSPFGWVKKTLAQIKTILGIDAATASASGVVELATNIETAGGTDTSRAITPDDLKFRIDSEAENLSEQIQYPLPTVAYMMKAAADGSPATATNTDAEVSDAVTKKHTQNTDTGTTATSFKINSAGNEADIQTTGLTNDRDFTLPDIDTMLAGSVVMTQNTMEIIAY